MCSTICAASSRVGARISTRVVPRGLSVQPVQDRQQEGRRLAAARHGAGEDVAAGEGGGDGVLLNGGRLLKAQALDTAEKVGVKAEIREIAQAFAILPGVRRRCMA